MEASTEREIVRGRETNTTAGAAVDIGSPRRSPGFGLLLDERPLDYVVTRLSNVRRDLEPAGVEHRARVDEHPGASANHHAILLRIQRRVGRCMWSINLVRELQFCELQFGELQSGEGS